MPQVFSPGEPETRPLDPEALFYTTPQKVADLLEIGPQEAVLVAADSDTDGVYVTGTDYRNIGFAVDDTILIYSDADPLGIDRTISSITTSINGVKLNFTPTITAADYQSADNTYIQNKSSFTNGRNRGLTYDKVKQLILRAQDRIDNTTHNSWRPNLVSAEYINFDTYKPYRRRYYTDYVGTTPLLFRNVQQMLRIELWQGDDYREIGAAEARIKIPDSVRDLSGSIVISPGNGSAASLTIGSGTTNWRADFDKITTAQNLADLINKEDRVSKAAVEFSPSFTLEGSTSNVSVHNEFLATANADYGSGQVKITSMRSTQAGESCSIVTTDSNIEIDQVATKTATFSSLDSTTITVDSTTGFVDAGVVVDASGDVFRYTGKTDTTFTGCVIVVGSALSDITGTLTQNILQVDLQGGSSSGDRARLRDYWLDHEMGIVYFNNSYPFFEWNAVKVAYIYGERYVEKAIEDVCTKMVAIELLMSDDRSVLIPEGTQNVDLASKIQLYRQDIDRTLPRYIEVITFE
jgi:hypothetical protein|tara:strand:- start:3911 stop:5476 length:1566 start_codon:yes stop_codon:yes gene_type:complete